jgi:long-chain acyl-CoA synthetase
MEPIWLKNYPPGVPAALSIDPAETIPRMLERICREFPERPAFSNLGRTISYRELDDLSGRFAAFLQQELKLVPGERVAIMMPNLLQYPVALYGALRAGLIAVNVNPLYTAHELEHQLRDSGAKAIVIVANSAAALEQARAGTNIEHVILTQIGDLLPAPKRWLVNLAVRFLRRLVPAYSLPDAIPFNAAFAIGADHLAVPALSGADVACLQYTGGTTGISKGATLTHGNLMANVRQMNTWFRGYSERGREIVITALPLYHVYALTCNCLAYTDLGSLDVLITDPRDIRGFIRELRRWKFTAITGVNTLYQHLANSPALATVDCSTLKLVSAGGMAVTEATAKRWAEVTGTEILEGYGLSETSPVVCSNPPDIKAWSGSIGLPLPGTEISLRDDHDREVAPGEAGEICVRGPQVMTGYWNRPDETALVMTSDGFLKTGDIATVDDKGYFKIVDRKKDMISVSGLKAYPNEIENVVSSYPAVFEAACIGVPDESTGQGIKLFVVLRPGMQATAKEIRAFCKESLAPYKVPRYIEFRASLPKSNVGKVLRRELRDGPAGLTSPAG